MIKFNRIMKTLTIEFEIPANPQGKTITINDVSERST